MSLPGSVPVIETADLILRGDRESDFEAVAVFAPERSGCRIEREAGLPGQPCQIRRHPKRGDH